MNVDKCFPTVAKVKTLQAREQLPPNLTVKATIEGFPVLLVMNFKDGDRGDVRILGVQQLLLILQSHISFSASFQDCALCVSFSFLAKITFSKTCGSSVDSIKVHSIRQESHPLSSFRRTLLTSNFC
jgi:hypothetical protein